MQQQSNNLKIVKFREYLYELEYLTNALHSCRVTLYREATGDEPRREILTFNRLARFFGHFFVKDDQVWFWSGRDQYSHLFVNLATNQVFEREASGPYAKFIWCEFNISANGKVLAVEGCVWSYPYEIVFFDFSNPEAGWPAIEVSWDRLAKSPPPGYQGFDLNHKSRWIWGKEDTSWKWVVGEASLGDTFIFAETCTWDRVLKERIYCTDDKARSEKANREKILWHQTKLKQETLPNGQLALFATDFYCAPQLEAEEEND